MSINDHNYSKSIIIKKNIILQKYHIQYENERNRLFPIDNTCTVNTQFLSTYNKDYTLQYENSSSNKNQKESINRLSTLSKSMKKYRDEIKKH